MSEAETPLEALGAKRIDVEDADQVALWSHELEIPESRLREVIALIGPMTAAIRYYVASPKFRIAAQ